MNTLTIEEKDELIPLILNWITERPITSFELVDKITRLGYQTNGIRIRLMIHEIRIKHLKLVLSSQKGYYTTNDLGEVFNYLKGLRLRAESILMAAHEIEQLAKSNANESRMS